MKHRKICAVLAGVLALTVLAGCGGPKQKTTNLSAEDIANLEVMEENTMPISEEGITIDVWTANRSQGYVKSFNEFESFKKLAEITGVSLNFIHPTGNTAEQLNIMLSSGDYPDVIYHNWTTTNGKKMIKDGVTFDLTPYIEKIAPNFRKVLEQPNYAKAFASMSDQIYSMPVIYDNPKFQAYNGYFIRKDWLDKLGLKVPETISEWEVVLKAFRDNDMNGNGDTTDEIPFSTFNSGVMYRYAFTSGFGAMDMLYHLDQEDPTKVTHAVLTPQFKDFVTTMARWYKEGLIYNNYISATTNEVDSLVLNDCLGAFYVDNNNSLPKYMTMNPEMELVAVPYPKNENGETYYPRPSFEDLQVGANGAMITSKCKYPVEAIRYFDYLYSKEASDLMYWGVEGESYTVEKDGSYKFTDLILNNPDGKVPYEAICKYMTNTGFTGMHQYQAMVGLESNLAPEFKKVKEASVNYAMEMDRSRSLNNVPTTVEEDKQIASYEDLSTYLSSMFDKFIIGAETIEKYDEFVEKCKELGIEEVVKIKQQAYDRIEK
ncbi:MAG: extracellular solute-binding protein [Clostridia bacterium]|nr:extracellular solute-binding protein [Clostridia bacterium]